VLAINFVCKFVWDSVRNQMRGFVCKFYMGVLGWLSGMSGCTAIESSHTTRGRCTAVNRIRATGGLQTAAGNPRVVSNG